MAMRKNELPVPVPEVYEHEQFGRIRVIKIDGDVKFVGTDVATALGYANPRDALAKHVPDHFKRESRIATPGGVQSVIVLDEAGLYRLVFRSKLPEAEKFTDWACEIMVNIRREGYYALPGAEVETDRFDKLEKAKLRLERQRLKLDRERLAFELKQAELANSADAKKMTTAQLLRELASAARDDKLRNDLVCQAATLLGVTVKFAEQQSSSTETRNARLSKSLTR